MMTVSNDDLIDFVYNEARMLDEGRYNEWLDLWLEDGHYWMPLDYQQTEARLMTSLLHEDLFMFCLLYTSPSPRDKRQSRMPSSA